MTKYPAQIDTSASLPSVVDNLTPVTGTVVNRLRDAILAIEGELGVHPAYGFGTVRARLDNIESIIGSSGHGIALAGDLGNTVDLPYVIGLRGRPLSTVSPNINDVLLWDGISWVPQPYINNGPAGGDLSANYPNPLVAGWAGKALDIATMGSPSDGEVPVWHAGSNSWRAAPNTISSSGVSPGSAGQVFFTSSGLVSTWTTVSGDILSSSSSVGSLSVISLLGEVSLEKYGAIGNGVTDDHMAYTNAMASGNSVLIGSKTYLVSGYSGATTAAGQSIIGFGNSSVIKANTPAIVTVATDNVSISNVQLLGDIVTSINNHGIDVSSKVHTRISDVLITTPGGRGVSISTGDVGTPEQGPQITAVRVYGAANDYAFYLNGAEYVGIVNSMADGSLGGAYIDGGNNILIANQFTACGTSLYINSVTDTNDGHMIILGNNFNHSTGSESIHIEPLAKGLSIDHSHIYGFTANIYVKGDAGLGKKSLVRFKDNEIAVDSLNFDGALVEFDGNIFTADGVAGTNNTFNTSYNSHASTIIYRPNNMQLDGTPFDAGVDAQWDVPNDRSLNIKWAGTTIRSHWDGYHGQFYAGDGITDSVAIIGPLIGSETSFASVWLLSPGILPTSTNWAFSGGNAGADTYVNAGGTIHLQIAGNPKGSLTASLFDIVTAIRFDNLAGSGTGYIQLDSYGNLSRVSTIPSGGVTPGAAGQVFITNATPAAAWTSLISVELTHGRFTAGGSGTDTSVVIGPRSGFETSLACLYLLPHGVSPGSNFALESDGTNLIYSAIGATGSHSFYASNASVLLAQIEGTHGRFTAGGLALESFVTIGPWTGGAADAAIWALPTGTAISPTNYGLLSNGTDTWLNAPVTGGDLHFYSGNTNHIGDWDGYHGRLTAGGNGSDFKTIIGPLAGAETSYGAIYFLPAATSPSTTNYGVAGEGTNIYLNAPGGFVATNTATVVLRDAGAVGALTINLNHAAGTNLEFSAGVTPSIVQDAQASAIATNDFTIKAQDAFATSGLAGGSLKLFYGNGDGAGAPGEVVIGHSTSAGIQIRLGNKGASSDTTFNGIFFLPFNVASSSSNFSFLGNGTDIYFNAPSSGGTMFFKAANSSTIIQATTSLVEIVPAIKMDNLAGTGTGYIQLDAAGNLTRVATVPTSTIAPGTAGQVLITNATPSAVWTSLIDVELTHGRFTAGGTGSDFKAVIGPYVGGETSFAAVYLLPGATASNSTNESLLSSSADTYLNAPNGTGILYFGQGGSFQLSFDSTATLQWALGATPKINQATQTADIATHDFTISPQAPFATATLTNRTPGSLLVNIAAPTNSGTTYGQFKVQLAGSTVAHIDSQHGVGTFGGNGSDFFASAGPVPGSETTLSALWLLGSASSLSSTNYAVLGDGTDTIINAPGSGGVFLRIANTNYFEVTSTDTYLGGYSASALLYVANSAGSINWTTTASPLITQDTPGSDGATNSITIQAQAPFATATINKSPGNTIIKTPSPLASANFFGGFLWERGDNTPGMRVGYYGGPDTTYTGIWFNDAGAPNTSNFGFLGNQNFTYLNVPSGGSLALSVAGSSSSGKSHSFTGGNTWQETTGAAVAAYILNVSAGYMAIETQSSFYVDAATIYMRDVAHNTTIAWGIVSSGASQMQIQSAVTSFSFNQLTQTVDAAPANITIAPQAPFATATGTNRKPGSLIVNLAVPTNSGTNEGRFEVRRNGVSLGTIKQYDGVANTAELILGYGLADSQYTLYNDASSQSHLNSPGTTLYFEISGSQKSYMSASTYHFTSMAILEFDSALSTPKLYQATTTGSPTSLTIQSQATSQVSTNGGDLILTSGSGGSGGVPGQVLIANDKIGINTTIGYGSGVGAGSTVLAGNPIYIESYNGSNNVLFYASALSADWNGSLGEFVVVADLNNFTFHKSATTPKLWQETPVSDVSTSNLTIQAQSPFASATVHTIAGDVIVNTPASVSSGVKNGGFAVAYNGTNQVKIGAYNNGAYSAIWLGAGAVSPSLTNFTLLDNGTGYAALNASGGGNLYLAVGNVNYVTLTSVLFSVNNSSQIGLSTGTNTLIGALKETTRTVSASFTLDTTTTDRDVFVTATLTLTLDTAAHADGRKVTIWVDTTSTGSNGSDITLTIAPAGTEKINGTNANWAITVPGSPEQIQKLEMIGDGTNIRIA